MKNNILFSIIFLLLIFSIFFIHELTKEITNYIKLEPKIIKEIIYIKQNEQNKYQKFIITAYTAGKESTGKDINDMNYGITASGKYVLERTTIACPKSMPFGTKIYIPEFENVFTCEDRGSDIIEGRLDIFMQDLEHAKIFGKRELDVFILPNN